MTTDERMLATWLAASDDAGLAQTFAFRGVPAAAAWHDAFDAAAALLDAASIDRALVRLPRRSLAVLARGESDPDLARLALTDLEGTPYSAVEARVRHAQTRNPDAFIDLTPPTQPAPAADAHEAAAAAERAFTAASALADLLLAAGTRRSPARAPGRSARSTASA